MCEGEDSPETRKVKGLMEEPAGHRNFGAGGRWRSGKGEGMPKGVAEGEEFERWLWRGRR